MKKIFPLCLIVALLIGGVAFVPASRANAQTAGLVSSILSRMERNGGTAVIRSEIGDGTEVELVLPRTPA